MATFANLDGTTAGSAVPLVNTGGSVVAFEWLPGASVGLLGAALAWWRSSSVATAVAETKIAALKEQLQNGEMLLRQGDAALGADLKDAAKELHQVVTEIKVMAAEQSVVNRVTNVALKGIVDRLDEHEHQINENATTLTLIRELIEAKRRSEGPTDFGGTIRPLLK